MEELVFFMVNSIEVKNLIKRYGKLTAVNDISFSVKKGEIFGLLGENGAGKTTTLEVIEGLRRPTSGKVLVLGKDFRKNINEIKERIGVQLQSSAYYNFLSLKDILNLFGSFYSKKIGPDRLLDMVDLKEKEKSYISQLSGGQKQRFSIVASLVNDPELVFLDEPTTGLDPLARRNLWDVITKIRKQGKTIILTTHYMEEAERLCDKVAIMDQGKILVMGDVHSLIEKVKNPYHATFLADRLKKSVIDEIKQCCGQLINPNGKNNYYELYVKNKSMFNKIINIIQREKIEDFTIGRASLEDLFLELTGKTIEE